MMQNSGGINMDFGGKTVVVTGAASGIGREVAKAFARRGAQIAAADINEEGLRSLFSELETKGARVYTQLVDIANPPQVADFCSKVYAEMGRVDVLCNNAGVACAGYLEDLSLEDWEWITGINLMGVIYGCHYFYPRMIEQGGGGHILNIASLAGLFPAGGSVPYSTTKFAVVGFSETLRAEAAFHNIGVSAICPSFVMSGIYSSARHRSLPAGETLEESAQRAEKLLGKRRSTAETVAEAVVKAVEKNRGVVPVCPEAHVADFVHRMSRSLTDKIITRLTAGGKKQYLKSRQQSLDIPGSFAKTFPQEGSNQTLPNSRISSCR
jgi:NAD(P)-dependent dehydrogenase (short-subunit alcohol dehydrogenase family)